MKVYAIALTIILAILLIGCGTNQTGKVPSGHNCQENQAYIQAGIDKYKAAFGAYPSDVNELLESKDGKGPFVEGIPACPSGNDYAIVDGIVKEVPRK